MLIEKTKYSYNDIGIVPAKISNIEHRNECHVHNADGFLPIFTAPMNTVVDRHNFFTFMKHGIIPILPRSENVIKRLVWAIHNRWAAFSLSEFNEHFCGENLKNRYSDTYKVLIDIANGHMSALYDSVKKCKDIYGDKIQIMVGNIANPKSYEIALNSEADYVRLSIGTGNGCITSSNTGIHYSIASLIAETVEVKRKYEISGVKCPKIIADGGIRNYSDVIKALALGADYVMIGSLFSSLQESAANTIYENGVAYKEFYGMASKEAQICLYGEKTKTAEGICKKIPVTTTIKTWVENMESYLKSAMSYCDINDICDFNEQNVDCVVLSKSTQESINK